MQGFEEKPHKVGQDNQPRFIISSQVQLEVIELFTDTATILNSIVSKDPLKHSITAV